MTGSRRIGWMAGGAIALGAVLATAGGCSQIEAALRPPDAPSSSAPAQVTRMPGDDTTVLGGDEDELAIATSEALFAHADVVVLADASAVPLAAGVAVRLGAPALLAPASQTTPTPRASDADGSLIDELERLDASTLVAVGPGATEWATAHGREAGIGHVVASLESALLPVSQADSPLERLTVVALPGASAARATAEAAGAAVVELQDPDPRRTAADATALSGRSLDHVLALGTAFGAPDRLRDRVETAATGVQLPGGGQVLFPGHRFVALYGHPGAPVLGVLGEQGIDDSIVRARRLADQYQAAFGETVVPTFEIIATVASGGAGPDGDYSAETSVDDLRPWVDAAKAAGVYVMLDLQPGRTDFLTQAKRYESLLAEPNVGLALDPEWRLGPDEHHLKNIGHVAAAEVNAVGLWLEQLAEGHRLPQKVFMIHEWRRSMLPDRQAIVTDYDDLGVVIHVDGFGSTGSKLQTWGAMLADAPTGVAWGWKNFIDEDKPMLTPEQTVATVQPAPVFISYQ